MLDEVWKVAGMIYMGVGKNDGVNVGWSEGEGEIALAGFSAAPLIHPAVE